ncbi:MAG: pitrilysin family protein [Alphaproteobacteria bacterium]|nr:pitrilysin family protein [Alphaproteobacteria bacterium]
MRDIQISTLSNGLRVVTDRMPTVESVSLGVWVRAGTRYEAPQVNGVAHLLEHMMFKGTSRRSAREIAEQIETVGGSINAYTSRETTAYYAKVLKNDAGLAIDVLSDIVQHSLVDDVELGRERSVVLQEIGQAHDTPDDVVFDHFQSTAFPDQPLGRPVLGKSEIVAAMSRDAIVGFHDEHYRTSRMVVAAAGNIEHDQMVDHAELVFGDLQNGDELVPNDAVYNGGEYREARDLEQIHLVLGFRGAPIGTPEFYTLSVLSNLFGGGMSSRLFQEIREERGLVYSIDTFMSAFADTGLFGVYAGTGTGQIGEMIPALCDQITGLADSLRDDEVIRARAQLKSSLLMALESSGARCEQVAQHLLIFGRVLPIDEMVARIDAIDAEQIGALARQIFSNPPVLAAVGPLDNLEPFDTITRRLAA